MRLLKQLTTGALAHDLIAFESGGVRLQSERTGRFAKRLFKKFPSLFVRDLPLSKLLMGGEHRRAAANYARLTGDLLRPSTSVERSPHAEFLRDYREVGDDLLRPERFALTRYWRNAHKCIELFGQYFTATTIDGVLERAAAFAHAFRNGDAAFRSAGGSSLGLPVRVSRINTRTASKSWTATTGLLWRARGAPRAIRVPSCLWIRH